MKEVLRFYAPVPVTIRRSVNEDTWLGKYKIPAHVSQSEVRSLVAILISYIKTFGVIPIAALHLSKKYWDNPDDLDPNLRLELTIQSYNIDAFNPDRWDSQQNISNFIYMPFLTGGRGCIG